MEKTNTDRVIGDNVFIETPFVSADGTNVTPKLKKDGTIVVGTFRDMLTSLKDFVIVGGDFV